MATTKPLTQKQEEFCQAVLTGKNMSEAYRAVYDTKNMNNNSINRAAWELMNNPKVTSRIEALRTPATVVAALTVESHLSELARLREAALQANQVGPAVTAEMARGKVAGFYIERRETGQAGEFAAMDAMRKADAVSAIQAELDRRARLANGSDQVDDVIPK